MYPETAWLYPSAVTEGLCLNPSYLGGLGRGFFWRGEWSVEGGGFVFSFFLYLS